MNEDLATEADAQFDDAKTFDHSLDHLLTEYRTTAKSEREKGTYFERLIRAYLENDPVQIEEYDGVWPYAEWAQAHDWDARDTGIDLVAKLRNEDGYCAIQCKFFDPGHHIQKGDIDRFLAASGKAPITRRLIVDTTEAPWGANAEATITGQSIPVVRLGLEDLRASRIDWSIFRARGEIALTPKKALYPYQHEALNAIRDGLRENDRGKLIMACGTGKTFTSLKVAEEHVGPGGTVLYMVPSLALMSQIIRDWTNDTDTPLRAFAVCSDQQVGKRQKHTDDVAEMESHDLAFPATTDPDKLANRAAGKDAERMTVIFATYQSIDVVKAAQQRGLPEFDLVVCDEAHRTTGARLADEDDSNFVKVHDNGHIQARKRLYMTATPRIYGTETRKKAEGQAIELCSMDDPDLYGPTLFTMNFSRAVEDGLLTDYKVIVLAMDEASVSAGVPERLEADNELKLDDATKIVGCYKALAKEGLQETDLSHDPHPMRRGLAFCKDIRTSKLIRDEFARVSAEYRRSVTGDDADTAADGFRCEVDHVDGTHGAKERARKLTWLGENHSDNTCRILSNARCLSEGVDVPALDAILFLHPRKSRIDVVQSVGRVMRRAPGKKLGYVILPVAIPAGVSPEDALNDNERYRVVWEVLNALRSHDERLAGAINSPHFESAGSGPIEIIPVTDQLPQAAQPETPGIGTGAAGENREAARSEEQLAFMWNDLPQRIRARIAQRVGNRTYWEDWAKDIADIAQRHITRIKEALRDETGEPRAKFDEFLNEIRDDLNDGVTEDEAIEMLAQHLITQPVFDALFEESRFTRDNPVSQAMESVIDALEPKRIDKEAQDLKAFYDSVRYRAQNVQDDAGKQQLIVELYQKFFKSAFRKTTQRLGIVYTPVEIVDFINNSVNEILQEEFGATLGSKGVHIIDPFAGTGTFITRLLQSGLITPDQLEHKYRHEIHANEVVLLAYYIAAVNIEAAYHGVAGGDYVPFEGICLTDTFQMYESEDLVAQIMPDNSERRKRQKAADIRVIVGNPPYSAKQGSADDNAANQSYPGLDSRIGTTYAAASTATRQADLYDSYIRAVRWGSDRLGEDGGVMAYVSNAGWIEGNAMDGLRKCLDEEFSNLYIFHLRGNARTQGEQRRKEKGNVFGEGTRTPVAITIHVKNPAATDHGQIHFHDIGDYLSEKEKLSIIRDFGSIRGIEQQAGWKLLEPDENNDWLNKGDRSFESFLALGVKSKSGHESVFRRYSKGIMTGRDAWCYNHSLDNLKSNISQSIAFYNYEADRYQNAIPKIPAKNFVTYDPRKISWDRAELKGVELGKKIEYSQNNITKFLYRPFTKEWCYFDRRFNNCVYQMPKLFPDQVKENMVICVSGEGAKDFTALMTNVPMDYNTLAAGAQGFPFKLYEEARQDEDDLLSTQGDRYQVRDGITDEALAHFQAVYPGGEITKEDLFYYIYGLLHSPDYRERFANNLSKDLPRIPTVKGFENFQAFAEAGRQLGDLHVNYEQVEPYPVTIAEGDLRLANIEDPKTFYRVEKMKFAGKRGSQDKSTVIYNSNITMTAIPLEAYDYVVNGKPALEWVMERQQVKTYKASGIVNDPNDYAIETMGDPAYPLKLFQRVITVSLETMKIVRALPELDIDEA